MSAVARVRSCAVCDVHAEAVFRVQGMDCNDEVVMLERRLTPLPGVESLAADVVAQRLRVSYDAAKVSTERLVEAAAEAGLRMWLEHEEPKGDLPGDAWRTRLMATSGLALAAALVAQALSFGSPAVVFALVATVAGAVAPLRRARVALRSRTLDINVLMVIAVLGALAIGEWFEAAAVVFLFALSQWLETRTLGHARAAISALIDLAPREALVRRADGERRVAVSGLVVGDVVVVRPGDKVPVDGAVVGGRSDVNESALTGESLPVDKGLGADVFAGTINGQGSLDVRVSRVGADTRMAHITHMVEEAQARRAPLEAFVDRFGRRYTPIVALTALAVAVVPVLAGGDASTWLYRALVLLVIACPCALVISTPVSIVAALSAAARHGVLVKGGAFLERLAAVNAVAVDKTGTLTLGQLAVDDVRPSAGWTSDDVLRWSAAVESRTTHPVARAVVHEARRRGLQWLDVEDFLFLPGRGAEGRVAGRAVLVGSAALMAERGVRTDDGGGPDATTGARVLVALDGVCIGGLHLSDQPRPRVREAIDLLRGQGLHPVVLLTGDSEPAARSIAQSLGIADYRAGLTPEAKVQAVEGLRRDGRVVAMVGDGINDAPALAAADVGVAMGAVGSDVALETADVALMSDDLLRLPYAIRLARATVRTIRVNVTISLALKAAFLVAAVTGTASLWMAVLADTGASVIVVANALRLLRAR